MSGNKNSGRRPKPTALKVLEGNRGKRPLPMEPKPRELAPDPPDWLSKAARAEWDRVVAEMVRVPGWLTLVDRALLAAYCQSYADFEALQRYIRRHGRTDKTGKMRPHVRMLNAERKAMSDLASHFGFSAATRARVNVGSAPPPATEVAVES